MWGQRAGMRFLPLLLLLLTLPAFAAPPLQAGPMIAFSDPFEVGIWVQTRGPATVAVRFWPKKAPGEVRQAGPQRTGRDDIALVRLKGLARDTAYAYEVHLNGAPVDLPYPTDFRTRPAIVYGGGPSDFRFAFGSCAYVNNPAMKETYGADYRIFRALDAMHPDFMLWLGDNVYLRDEEWTAESSMRSRYRHTRSLPEMQPLLARSAHYAIWDDHDYGPNDADWTFPLRRASLKVFGDYWPAQSYGPAGFPGAYQRFSWSDVDFFLLDDRYYRDPKALKGPGKAMLGPGQMEWLLDGLASSTATFKVVAVGSQTLSPHMDFESWGLYPEERQRFLDFLTAQGVKGVVLLTGDRHATELLRLERPGQYPLYEYTSSPLTSGMATGDREKVNPVRVPGTWVKDRRNFGIAEVSGPQGARRMLLKAFDADGKELWRHEITQEELGG